MKNLRIQHLVYSLVLVALLVLGGGCSLLPDINTPQPPPPESPLTHNIVPVDPDWALPPVLNQGLPLPDFVSVVARVRPSVVAINTEVVTYDIFNRPFTQEGAGSGWIIDKTGYIVTNNHVVEGAKSIMATLADGRTLSASIVGTDALDDLAVLKVSAGGLVSVDVGDSAQIRVGDWVLAVGNPLGLGISAKEGIISRIDVPVSVSSGQTLYDLIETSAAINPGNSGGPLVNMNGEVIGITSIKIATVGVEGLGYAISTRMASPIIEKLIQKGYVVRSWLGVVLLGVDGGVAIRYGLSVNQGVLVTEVASGSPAAKAGLMAGDVIVGLDGIEIKNVEQLIQAIHNSQIGRRVNIEFIRDNAQDNTQATLVESPPP
ncbi:S1C family serine protease [Chloroflexota bacterium]